ncbi:Calcineurin-like phosphoesterase [Globisporangium polare]
MLSHHHRRHVILLQSAALLLLLLLLLLWGSGISASKAPLVAHIAPSGNINASSSNGSAEPGGLSFKILQLTDLHFSGDPTRACKDAPGNLNVPCTEALMSTFIDELLDVEQPDLVVFSGDAIQSLGSSYQQLAIDAFTKSVEARGIPHAEVLGNHDDDNGFSREDVLAAMMSKHYSYTQRGSQTIEGVGNYQLSVQAPVDGPWGRAGDNVFHMYFLDSGGNLNKTRYPDAISRYDWIHESQVQYYRELSDATKAAQVSGSASVSGISREPPLPAVMFFHIPLQEFAEASLKFRWRTGEMNEKVEPSLVHSTLFPALVRQNEVKAVFAGHDHTNAYCFHKNGLQLCCAGGAGLGLAYGSDDFARRARVIEWSVSGNNERTIKSWKRLFGRLTARYEPEVLFTQEAAMQVGLESSSGGHLRGSCHLWLPMTASAVLSALVNMS